MSVLLDDEDALFDSGSFTLIHNGTVYHVDPTIFFNFSRKFASMFQYVTNNPQIDEETGEKLDQCIILPEDNYSEDAFATYVEACQMKPIAPSGIILVDILVIAEDWDSPTLISKIELLLSTVVSPNELVRLFAKILKENKRSVRIENIITTNLPRFIEAPLFSTLPFEVIERMIGGYQGKLTPAQLIKLCYAASAQGGMNSMKFVKRYSFDRMKLDSINDLVITFGQCPYRQLRDFFIAMGRLLEQLTTPINSHKAFKDKWSLADKGTGEDAYNFYLDVKDKNTSGVSSATEQTFLKTAAERGHAHAQYEWGAALLDKAKTEEQEDKAVEFLIQAAAKGVKDAVPLLEPYFSLKMIDESEHEYVYQNLALQIVLLNMNEDNLDASRQSIHALNFTDSEARVLLLAQAIMKAVTCRQRNINLYADLIGYLSELPGYEKLKQDIFSLIVLSLFDKTPGCLQFVNLRFLYNCQRRDVFLESEIEGPIMEFVRTNAPIFVKSTLMVYYWFAPIVEKSNPEVSTFIFMKALMIEKRDFGGFDKHMLDFKFNVRALREKKWDGFYTLRDEEFYKDPVMHAIIYDDLAAFKLIAEQPGFNINKRIPNWVVDLAVPGEEEPWDRKFTLIQYAALQGARTVFLYLLRRGAKFLESNNSISATCVACGQDKFILGFITDIKEEVREEMFRMAGKFNNIYLMILLLQNPIDVNSADSKGSTSLHFATRNQNNGVVSLLCHTSGVDVNAQTDDGVTPFHYAIFSGKIITAQILADAQGIDLNCTDKHGSTPLHYAVWNNDIVLVKWLLSLEEVDVNAQAKLQRTPLHEAAKCGFLDIVRLLVKAKEIDLNPLDQSHRTPLKLAMKRHQIDIVQFLNTVEGVDNISTTIISEPGSEKSEPGNATDFLFDPY